MPDVWTWKPPLPNLGCYWCDRGFSRFCSENELTNPLHLGFDWFGKTAEKCGVPDCVVESIDA